MDIGFMLQGLGIPIDIRCSIDLSGFLQLPYHADCSNESPAVFHDSSLQLLSSLVGRRYKTEGWNICIRWGGSKRGGKARLTEPERQYEPTIDPTSLTPQGKPLCYSRRKKWMRWCSSREVLVLGANPSDLLYASHCFQEHWVWISQ